jgi:hypothetical protein
MTIGGGVNLAADTRDSNKSTEWKIHILSDRVVMLENQGRIDGSRWLNGITYGGGSVNLSSDTEDTGTKWRIIKQ